MPKNIKTIESSAFSHSNLEEIVFPDGLKKIDSYAFASCKKLKEIYLPDGVESVGENAFCLVPAKVSYFYKTTFEDYPDNSKARRQTAAEIAKQRRKEEMRNGGAHKATGT